MLNQRILSFYQSISDIYIAIIFNGSSRLPFQALVVVAYSDVMKLWWSNSS
jgi:hypothetical protein